MRSLQFQCLDIGFNNVVYFQTNLQQTIVDIMFQAHKNHVEEIAEKLLE